MIARHNGRTTGRFLAGLAIVLAGLWIIVLRLLLDGDAITPPLLLASIACIAAATALGGLLRAGSRHLGRNMRRRTDVHA